MEYLQTVSFMPEEELGVLSTVLNITSSKIHRRVPIRSICSFTLGCIGNILAIWVLVCTKKEHKWSMFYKFVFALAITDFVGIISTSPIVFAFFHGSVTLKDNAVLCGYMAIMLIFAGLSTNFLVAAMSVDRYMLIMHPLKHRLFEKDKTLKIFIVLIWFISAGFAILPMFGLGEYVVHFPKSWCFFNFFGTKLEDQILTYLFVSIGFITVTITAVATMGSIIGTIRKRASIQRSLSGRRAIRNRANNDRSLIVYLMIVFLIFTSCWTPFMVKLVMNQMQFRAANPYGDVIVLSCASWNQVLDPWVYLFRLIVKFFTRYCRISRSDRNSVVELHECENSKRTDQQAREE